MPITWPKTTLPPINQPVLMPALDFENLTKEVSSFYPNTAISVRSLIIHQCFEHIILFYNGLPVAKTTRDRGWDFDEYVNF